MDTADAYWELLIWDVGLWESAGQGETAWVIQIDGLPDDFRSDFPVFHYDPEVFAIYLTPDEVGHLKLEEEVRESFEALSQTFGKNSQEALDAKSITIQGVDDFFKQYDVPDRVKRILASLPEAPPATPAWVSPWGD